MALDEKIEKAIQLEKFNEECGLRKLGDLKANFTQASLEIDKCDKRLGEIDH